MKNEPYLLQRLKKPYPVSDNSKLGLIQNAFSFGGGYKNGGLNKDLMLLFNQIWSYDYMGSAEFEFGALPESWQRIYQNQKDYVLGSVEVTARKENYRSKKPTTLEKDATVYYLCKSEDEAEVKEWIAKFADQVKDDFHTLEHVGLASCILDESNSPFPVMGWHDLDNDYLFFSRKEMFDKMIEVLQIKETD